MQGVMNRDASIGCMLEAARRMARRYGQVGLHEPDDIAQMAMMKLLKRAGDELPGFGWLYRVVQSVAVDAGREFAREAKLLSMLDRESYFRTVCESVDEDGMTHKLAGYVQRVDTVDLDVMPRLMAVLAALSEPLRQVLVLHTEGYSYEEIAEMTMVPLGTVRSRMHYARKAARKMLKDLELID